MRGYDDGFNACFGDFEVDGNEGNLKVIVSVDTFFCNTNFRISIGGETVGNIESCSSPRTFTANVNVFERVSVCAYGTDTDLSGCADIVNGPEKEPERVNIYVD